MLFKNRKNEKGQAVLIVLLSLSVVLIVILYILSRTITDVSLSSKEEDSLRAFSAAEAGIEKALVGLYAVGSSSGPVAIGDGTFTANVSAFSKGSSQSVYPIPLKSGESATFWFTEHDATTGDLACNASNLCFNGTQAKFCWGDSGTLNNAQSPALEISIYYKVGSEYRISRTMVDPVAGRTQNNSAVAAGCNNLNGENFQYGYTYNLTGLTNLQFATAKILYNTTQAHKIAIDVSSSGSTLPSQGAKVNSNGTFADSNRSIEVYQLHPEVPPIFTNAIYTAANVIKNN